VAHILYKNWKYEFVSGAWNFVITIDKIDTTIYIYIYERQKTYIYVKTN